MAVHTRILLHTNGPALWPEHKPEKDVLELKRTTPESIWEATYQGNASPPGGSIFHRAWWLNKNRYRLKDYDPRQVVGRWQSWDTAMKDKDGAAYTVCVTAELLADYRLIVRDVFRERLDFPALPELIERMAEEWNKDGLLQAIIIEDRASGTSAFQTLALSINQRLISLLVPFMPFASKSTRAEQAAVYCRENAILLPAPDPEFAWLFPFEEELYAAPAGVFMDQVDAFAQLILYIEHILAIGTHFRAENPEAEQLFVQTGLVGPALTDEDDDLYWIKDDGYERAKALFGEREN